MAQKKMKGVRANKPNDSFGTVNNDALYKNKYREEVDKDDDDEVEEVQADPAEKPAATQKETETTSESFVEKKTAKEEVDYKKRYDDLKRHYDSKVEEWKEEKLKPVSENPTQDPQFTSNMANFKQQYPDVYEAVEQLSASKAESTISALKQEVDSLKNNETTLQKQKAYEELLRLQPDFENLKTDDKFLRWLEEQPQSISDGIYNNNTDSRWASRIVDLYKADAGSKTTKPTKRNDAASSVSSTTTKEISTQGGKEKVWKASEIEKMKPWEYEKYESEIDKARTEGRLDLSS